MFFSEDFGEDFIEARGGLLEFAGDFVSIYTEGVHVLGVSDELLELAFREGLGNGHESVAHLVRCGARDAVCLTIAIPVSAVGLLLEILEDALVRRITQQTMLFQLSCGEIR